jgi:aspartyl-tRNA(Asn)/glutamyl-tRNA(Gln) amidotransferase subunit C
MKIDNDMVNRIAALAYLSFEDEDREQIRADLEKILSFVEKLNELDTSDTEPLIYLSDSKKLLRKDRLSVHLNRKNALLNAPETDGEYFLVPKVIDDKSGTLQ